MNEEFIDPEFENVWARKHLSAREKGWIAIATVVPTASIIGSCVMRYIDNSSTPGCAALMVVTAFITSIICPLFGFYGFSQERTKSAK